MKKLLTNFQLCLVGMIAVFAVSCKNEKLENAIKVPTYASVTASLPTSTTIGTGSTATLTGASLTIPATITLSAAAASTFTIDLSINTDTVTKLITAGTLPAGTTPFPSNGVAVVNQVTVPAGVTSVSFNIVVSRSAMELNYGKNLATTVKISNAIKGNKIDAGKNAMIVVVKTGEVLLANSIHEIAFGSTTKVFDVTANPSSYTSGSLFVNVSIPIILQGDPGADVSVDVVVSPDSVTKYIGTSLLPNNSLYPASNFTINNPTVKIAAGTNTGTLTFSTKIQTLLALQPSPGAPTVNYPTFAITLKNPTNYQISKTKVTTLYVVLNPNTFRPYYGTPFLINGNIGVASAPFYAAYYDFGGEGIAYHDNNTKDGDGSWRAPDYVDVSGDYSPRSVVGWTSNDEWLTYSINVQQAGTYQINSMLGSPNTGQTYSIYIDNVVVVNKATVINTTNYSNQGPNISPGIVLTAGYHIVKMYWNTAAYDFRGLIFTRTN
jgi:hypothetical protein